MIIGESEGGGNSGEGERELIDIGEAVGADERWEGNGGSVCEGKGRSACEGEGVSDDDADDS
jgi:hypothetical protein